MTLCSMENFFTCQVERLVLSMHRNSNERGRAHVKAQWINGGGPRLLALG